ncbi:hypothetical protein HS088_TW06G00350 [Tripterygium wilfordii]|uniref:Uncharacterized protein n=1 Tax=Tripterygium wilfordii TaxID=458696 RepID=A0A7J7DIP3_TRIWF|nr:hypothetical protein HS088_TW06G00350 [Tripterygium wilfordii]
MCSMTCFVSQTSNDMSCVSEMSSSLRGVFKKKSSSIKHVRFVGIDIEPSNVQDKSTQRMNNAQAQGRKRRPSHGLAWQPQLNTISEKNNE